MQCHQPEVCRYNRVHHQAIKPLGELFLFIIFRVSGCLYWRQAITCTSTTDYRTLTAAFFGNNGLGLGDVTINNYSATNAPTLEYQRPFFSSQELKEKYNMDGWALDFIEGPAPVLNMLCHECKVHQRV